MLLLQGKEIELVIQRKADTERRFLVLRLAGLFGLFGVLCLGVVRGRGELAGHRQHERAREMKETRAPFVSSFWPL